MKSMTGFGTGRIEQEAIGTLSIELRSVNSRFLDLVFRLPVELSTFDPLARAELQKRFSRGKLSMMVAFHSLPGTGQRYGLNEELLARLEEYCIARGREPEVETLLGIPGVVVAQPDDSRLEDLERMFQSALALAMDSLESERAREGEALRLALATIARQMRERLAVIEQARPQVVARFREKLAERIEELLGPKSGMMEPGRLEMEVAMFADRADIQEEVTRLSTHLDRLDDLLTPNNAEARGRALDFLNQEILREINTIGSKARDVEITRQVLELKNLAESLKEQVANVE